MRLRPPYLSVFDPEISGEGGIDPPSLQPLYERLAERILPHITVRMSRPRFLTAMAVGFLAWILSEWLYPNLAGDVIGLVFALLAIIIVTPLSQTFDPPRLLIDECGKPINLKDRLGILPLFSRVKPEGTSSDEADEPQSIG